MSNDTAAREAASTLLLSRKNVNPQDLGAEDFHKPHVETTEEPDDAKKQTSKAFQRQSSASPNRSSQSKSSGMTRKKIPIKFQRKHVFFAGIGLFAVAFIIVALSMTGPSKPTKEPDLSNFGKKQEKPEISLTAPTQTGQSDKQVGQQDNGLSLNHELTQLPEIPTQTTPQNSVEIDELKEKLSSLETQLTEALSQLNEKETELKNISQSVSTLKTNLSSTESAVSKIPSIEAEVTNIKNAQEYQKVVQEEKEQRSDFQILNEDSIEIYGKVYYVGSIIKYNNKKYAIKKIDFNKGVFLQDGAQQIYRIPIKKQ